MSWTAEIIYSLLLYRAQLSKKNRWIDSEGRIYIQFSNASLAKALHKCEASVRNALRELEKAGLIEKRSNAGSANTIYLKLPDSSESQPKPRPKTDTQPCQKTSTLPHQKANTPPVRNMTPPCQETNTGGARKLTPRYKELDNRTVNSKREKALARQSYGSYGNVFLTDAEYQKLSVDIPYLDNLIEQLSAYMESTGKKYKSHAATLRVWAARDRYQQKPRSSGMPDYSFKEGESL